MKYKQVEHNDIQGYLEKANHWYNEQNPANMFASCQHAAIMAITEYLANQDGLTIYEDGHGVEK